MAEIRTETVIEAPAEKIWKKLIDFRGYPQWNPLVVKIDGEARLGADIVIHLALPGGLTPGLPVTLESVSENRELRWKGSAPVLPFLITGDHYFRLESLGPKTTRFVHGEEFTGLLAPVLEPLIVSQGTPLYERLNMVLKQLCE